MKNLLTTLMLLSSFMFITPTYAGSACGSDTAPDPDVARGKDVWLNGHCQSFLPCRLVLAQLHACEAVKNFLTNLNAQKDVPLTESQVEEALIRTKNTANASTPKMAKISASIERDRVATLDNSTVAALQSDCSERACMNYREKQLNLLSSEVDKLNRNADVLYWFPEYAPVQAFAAAERQGWTRQGGKWVLADVPQRSGSDKVEKPAKHLIDAVQGSWCENEAFLCDKSKYTFSGSSGVGRIYVKQVNECYGESAQINELIGEYTFQVIPINSREFTLSKDDGSVSNGELIDGVISLGGTSMQRCSQ